MHNVMERKGRNSIGSGVNLLNFKVQSSLRLQVQMNLEKATWKVHQRFHGSNFNKGSDCKMVQETVGEL